MAKKKPDIDIYEGDICIDPNLDLVENLLENTLIETSPILNVESEFMADIGQEAEARLLAKEVIIPASAPSQGLKNNAHGVMNINIKPGSSLSHAIANPTENDNLLAVIRDNKPINTVLKAIMEEIAEEAAYLKAWRNENWSTGEDLSEPTFKRIKILKHLVETIVEQEKLKKDTVSGKVDFHGEPFQKVLKFFLETIQKTFRKVHIPEQFEDIFFTELAKSFDSFEKNAERIYYGKD
jgi:hypothetical protein